MREKVVQFFKVQLLFSDYSSFFLLWSVAHNFYARLAWLFQCTTTIFMLKVHVLILFRMGFFWAAYRWGGTFWPPSLKSVTHILQWWNLAQLYLTSGKSPKYIYITWHIPLVLLTSTFFHQKSAKFATSRNEDIDWILIHNF